MGVLRGCFRTVSVHASCNGAVQVTCRLEIQGHERFGHDSCGCGGVEFGSRFIRVLRGRSDWSSVLLKDLKSISKSLRLGPRERTPVALAVRKSLKRTHDLFVGNEEMKRVEARELQEI